MQEIITQQTKETNEYKELMDSIYSNEIVLSYSALKNFYINPRTFVQYKLGKKERTPSMIFGSLIDCLLFTPELFEKDFVISDSRPTTDKQVAFVADFIEMQSQGKSEEDCVQLAFAKNYSRGSSESTYQSLKGYIDALVSKKDVVSAEDKEKAERIAEAVKNNSAASMLLEQSLGVQKHIEFEYKGLKFRGFLDTYGEGFIVDGKFRGRGADVQEFTWDFKKLHYDLQGAIYKHGAMENGLDSNPEYFNVVYDMNCDVSVVKIDPSYLIFGMQKFDFIIQEFKRCKKENGWLSSFDFYGMNGGVYELVKPPYASLKGVLK